MESIDIEKFIKVIKDICTYKNINQIISFEYKGRNNKGNNKYKIKYRNPDYINMICTDTIEEKNEV